MAGYKDPPKHTRFKPGQSGNPAGRPKRPDIASLDRLISECGTEQKIAETWIARALGDESRGIDADFQWFKLLIEHRNGSPPKEQTDDAEKVREDIEAIRDLVDDIKATTEGPGAGGAVGRKAGKPKRVRGA